MAGPLYANNVAALLQTTIGPSDVLMTLGAGQGAQFPAVTTASGNWYYATIVHNVSGLVEIVKVTNRTGDVLTVTRAQDGTAAISFAAGSVVEMRLIAQTLRELDFRTFFGTPSGIATLDSTGKLVQSQIPVNIPLLTAGKLDIGVIPDVVALDADVALKANKAGDTFTGAVVLAMGADVLPLSITGAFPSVGRQMPFVNTADGPGSSFGFKLQSGTSGGTSIADASPLYTGLMMFQGKFFIENPNANGGLAFSATGASGSHTWYLGASRVQKMILSSAGLAVADALTCGGALSAAGSLTAAGVITNQNMTSSTATLVIATTGDGNIYFRPKGAAVVTNEAAIGPTGLFTAIDFQATSDRELKDSLGRLQFREDLADQIQLWSWIWKGSDAAGRGPVAQEVQEYAPEFVGKGGNGYLSIDKAGLALATIPGIAARLRRLEAALNLEVQPCFPAN